MIKKLSLLALPVFLLAFLSLPCVFAADGLKPVYRIYNEGNGEHLYSSDVNEVSTLTRGVWKAEGTSWKSPNEGTGVYRLYSPATRYHLFTTDTNEVSTLSGKGWQVDNGGQPLFYSGGTVPVYRLYHEGQKCHLLTTDANEYNTLAGQGWNQEGVKFNAVELGSPVEGAYNISNVDSAAAIETDLVLTGSGQGYHAKVLAQTPLAGVSFGLQFDQGGMGNYKGNTGFIIENVMSNAAGQQQYHRPGLGASGVPYRVMLAVQNDGNCTFYVNGFPYGPTVSNPNLLNDRIDMSVEGSGKVNGDTVSAAFSNIKIKSGGTYDPNKVWKATPRDTNPNVHSDVSKYDSNKSVTIGGTVTGLAPNQDWDNAYNKVSGIATFYPQ